ncbi:MAG: ATP-binding cassette domain-containing protein [Rhodobacterales bacterium]|nr:ATP-binding cassette domain-containing protein [Rhodobacterales bacterium]
MTDRLELRGLSVQVGATTLVHDVDLDWRAGEKIALVGPSGAGKTLTARALLGLVDLSPGVVSGQLTVHVGQRKYQPYANALAASTTRRERAFAAIRGEVIAYLPQDTHAALDPLCRVGSQVRRAAPSGQAVDVVDCLRRSGFSDPSRVRLLWPHQLSGGMAQRVAIAQVLARQSKFLVVDEPTTGLDSLTRALLLTELDRLARSGVGILLITHDLRILPDFADRVYFMDQGRFVEVIAGSELPNATSPTGRRLVQATRKIAGGRLG